MKTMRFTLDGENEYSGYSTGNTWNGFMVPLFDYTTAEELLNAELEDEWIYNGKLDAFLTDEDEEFKGEDHYVDGEVRRLYPIGAFSWVWQIDEDITE